MSESKGFFGEFKEFIAKGNVMDMAVGIIIGGAFKTIVDSLVNDMVMPAVGMLIGKVNFSDLKVVLSPAEGDVAEVAVKYGLFIQNIINFLLVAFVLFCVIKMMNKLRRKEEEPEKDPEPSDEAVLLTEIRDLLKKD